MFSIVYALNRKCLFLVPRFPEISEKTEDPDDFEQKPV